MIVFQLDFEIYRTIDSFIKISPGHSLMIKQFFYKVLQDNFRIGGKCPETGA